MLQGRLVRLRAREPDDAERSNRWLNDWQVARFLVARYPASAHTERAWMRAIPGPSFRGLALAIETLAGAHIGNVELRDIQPEDRTAEVGILIGEPDQWGQGYGADAVRTLARFAFHEMNLERLYLRTYEFNERGQRAFARAGFRVEGRLRRHVFVDGRRWDVILMGLLREEFADQETARP